MRFSGKCAIVTGSSSGIGKATAILLAKEGASVLIHGRDLSTIKETVAECEKVAVDDAKFPYVQGDIEDDDVLKSIRETAIKAFDKIDILVNNAGYGVFHDLTSGSLQLFDNLVKVLLRAPIHLSQMCLPELKQNNGNIVNISSVFGCQVTDLMPFYSIAKAGMNMFTQCAALEFGGQGVRVNAVCPGLVKTPAIQKAGIPEDAEAKHYSNVARCVPLGKIGTMDETAKLIAFLASDDASMMNGACLVQDGGHSLIGLDKATLENAAK